MQINSNPYNESEFASNEISAVSIEDDFKQALDEDIDITPTLKKYFFLLPPITFRTIYFSFLAEQLSIETDEIVDEIEKEEIIKESKVKDCILNANKPCYLCSVCNKSFTIRKDSRVLTHSNIAQSNEIHYFCNKKCRTKWINQIRENEEIKRL